MTTLNALLASKSSRYTLTFFFFVMLIITIMVSLSKTLNNPMLALVGVIAPSLVAMVLVTREGEQKLSTFFRQNNHWGFHKLWLIPVFLFIPALIISAVAIQAFVSGTTINLTSQLPHNWSNKIPQIIIVTIIAIGEEIGWRGYALSRLQQKYNSLVAGLTVGGVWALWHFPGYLTGMGVPLNLSFILFIFWVLALSILMTWLYNKTHNVWLMAALHAVSNFTFSLFPLLPEQTGETTTFAVFTTLVVFTALVIIATQGINLGATDKTKKPI